MNNKKCENCYFGDKCKSLCVCDNYFPIYDLTDDEVAEMVENERPEFQDAWNQYIEKCSN